MPGDKPTVRYRKCWFRKKEAVRVDSYKRLVFILKLRKHKRLGEVDVNAVFMKIFKDIPKLDLEMLLPGARVQWPKTRFWAFWGLLAGNLTWLMINIAKPLFAALMLLGGLAAMRGNFEQMWGDFTRAAVLGPSPSSVASLTASSPCTRAPARPIT